MAAASAKGRPSALAVAIAARFGRARARGNPGPNCAFIPRSAPAAPAATVLSVIRTSSGSCGAVPILFAFTIISKKADCDSCHRHTQKSRD